MFAIKSPRGFFGFEGRVGWGEEGWGVGDE